MSDADCRCQGLDNLLCASCGEHPAQTLAVIRIPIGPNTPSAEQIIRDVIAWETGAATPARQANARLEIPCCGICYDQIMNYVIRDVGDFMVATGWDFRERADELQDDTGSVVAAMNLRDQLLRFVDLWNVGVGR